MGHRKSGERIAEIGRVAEELRRLVLERTDAEPTAVLQVIAEPRRWRTAHGTAVARIMIFAEVGRVQVNVQQAAGLFAAIAT